MADIELIKQLREATDLSFSEIRKALEQAGGDKDKALEILKKHGAVVAEKKASRSTAEGYIGSYIHSTGKIGTLVELLCETDFVARNPLFKDLAKELAMHIAATEPETIDTLLEQPYIKDPTISVRELVNQSIGKLGENIKINRFIRFAI